MGAKAGKQLRNDGIASLLYAIALIMLYIAFRFDFRYGPGTVAALLHDAIMVVGVFAVTWNEFSLTTVAARAHHRRLLDERHRRGVRPRP